METKQCWRWVGCWTRVKFLHKGNGLVAVWDSRRGETFNVAYNMAVFTDKDISQRLFGEVEK